ncbi:hypothetical protein [Vibrio sp. SCSIO 43137]|uniref:hypothetical protein n=1 Tax=Vibrio sp. SCSIO 43137 TaxID=3021011 RepID=UPI0023071864|nr:hypothetical protein [Vibrio sp. SCSIO 43137]WCE31297.1 hypothetical protein PK654_14745 [Vibrio sp. SCSIO 43137]
MGINRSLAHLSVSGSKSSRKDTNQGSEEVVAAPVNEPAGSMVATVQAEAMPVVEVTGELTDWCISVFGTLFSIYESKWEHVHGSEPNTKFILFTENLTQADFDRLLRHCRERIQRGEYWPPSTGELQVLSKELTTEERMDSRVRVLSRSPANEIEKWLVQNKLYELKRVPEYKLDELFKRYYLEAKSLQERGMLVTEFQDNLLAQHSVKNMNDLKREEYIQSHGSALNPRIQKILDSKK